MVDSIYLIPPKFFGFTLHSKILKKEPLSSNEYLKVVREISRIVEPYTQHPHEDCLKILIQRCFVEYPGLLLKGDLESQTSVSASEFYHIHSLITPYFLFLQKMIRVKIQKHFENERRKCKGNVSGYRKGRPKNSLDGSRGPRGEMWQNEDTDKGRSFSFYKYFSCTCN